MPGIIYLFIYYVVWAHLQIQVILDTAPHIASRPLIPRGAVLLWGRDIAAGEWLRDCASSGLSSQAAAGSSDSPIWEEAKLQTYKEQSQKS